MEKLSSQLAGVETVAIIGHIHPDGDCVGSCLATYNYIKTYFAEIKVDVYLEPIPKIFAFLKGADRIIHTWGKTKDYDLCIVQDAGDLGRLGEAVKYFRSAAKTICIDHHISNGSYADENYIFPQVSSTSELIFDLIGKEYVTKDIAECIYVGMIHDTGVFQYSSTTAKSMDIAGFLMEKGIDFTKIVDDTFYTKTYAQNRMLGSVLLNSKLYLNGNLIIGTVSQKEMKKFDVLPKHLDGIVNQLRVTKGVRAAVFCYESEDGFKVSMRSNDGVDVSRIAQAFGGGGHVKAAGATMNGTLDEVIQKIVVEIEKQL
jgi:phosphoesterase RecJ-like protein